MRRSVESEMRTMQNSWGSVTRLAQDRQKWRDFVGALDTTTHDDDDDDDTIRRSMTLLLSEVLENVCAMSGSARRKQN